MPGCGACKNKPTSTQTPVNIVQAQPDLTLKYPEFNAENGGCNKWAQFSNTHAYEVSFAEVGCHNLNITYDEKDWVLQQLHFHTTSEHSVGGGLYAAEVHLVHAAADGSLLVIGVLIESSSSTSGNMFLRNFWAHGAFTASTQTAKTPINPYTDFLPGSRNFYTYMGSLSTPPCTEGVTWIVFKDIMTVSPSDLKNIHDSVKRTPHNIVNPKTGYSNRPVQPLNGRVVKEYIGFSLP